MSIDDSIDVPASNAGNCNVSEISTSQLVGEIYGAAPAIDQPHLLEQLPRPLGMLVAIVGEIFAKIRFCGGWSELHVRLEDAQTGQAADFITLADYEQQVSSETVDGLAQTLTASPALVGSLPGALPLIMLVHRSMSRRVRKSQSAVAAAA